ncbi:uncharacterized protein LOC107861801 [Capsicum annuum]|uniref:uncharacterized protein LOC107861801 n=1 Tax=Capsicum annuum TaxID=4072 RepID=UPI001FB1997D|nr:uncharacterized protein LOC107861801 [Capsicum annuum]
MPQIQIHYQGNPMPPPQDPLNQNHPIQLREEMVIESKGDEVSFQDGEKLDVEIQEECEEKKEKEREVAGSEVEKEKNCLIVGFVHKEPLSLPNSKASILPSFDSSYVQVLEEMIIKKDPKGVLHESMRNELEAHLTKSAKKVGCPSLTRDLNLRTNSFKMERMIQAQGASKEQVWSKGQVFGISKQLKTFRSILKPWSREGRKKTYTLKRHPK